ncbi:MAG: HAD-IA family hydrolase [Hyphomonadaceae bacterium]|nr:HAD-IA family hydrolase [Hyphomonadaceae bacterium]
MAAAAVIFDCDGVLVDSEVLALQYERAHLAEAGLQYGAEEFAARFMGLAKASFHAELLADSRERLGASLPEGFFDKLDLAKQHAFQTQLQAVPGARQAVASWAGLRAVASSSPRKELLEKLQRTDLSRLFEPNIYSAEQVARGKPAPDVFLLAAQQLAAPPGVCLVIEDSVNGVLAARAAGMRVWGFTGGGHADAAMARRLSQAGADSIIPHHEALTAALQAEQA